MSVKVYHCVNGDGPIDGKNGFCTHFAHQMVCLHSHNVNFTDGNGDGDGKCKQSVRCSGEFNSVLCKEKMLGIHKENDNC